MMSSPCLTRAAPGGVRHCGGGGRRRLRPAAPPIGPVLQIHQLSALTMRAFRHSLRAYSPGKTAPGVGVSAGCENDTGRYATADEETVVAVVSGELSGAVSIIRLSGSRAVSIAGTVFRPTGSGDRSNSDWTPKSHRVYYGFATDKAGAVLDEVLAIVMLAPRSYTREDVVELHCHGGGVCARRVVSACLDAGAMLARPGEFTLRAFLNGRLDLTQVRPSLNLHLTSVLTVPPTPRRSAQATAWPTGGERAAACERKNDSCRRQRNCRPTGASPCLILTHYDRNVTCITAK
jgi:hypothetical protein